MTCTTPSLTPVVGVATDYDQADPEYLLGIGSKINCVWNLTVTDLYLETEDGLSIETEQLPSDDPLLIES